MVILLGLLGIDTIISTKEVCEKSLVSMALTMFGEIFSKLGMILLRLWVVKCRNLYLDECFQEETSYSLPCLQFFQTSKADG